LSRSIVNIKTVFIGPICIFSCENLKGKINFGIFFSKIFGDADFEHQIFLEIFEGSRKVANPAPSGYPVRAEGGE
jgi:hypothetical protein